MSKRLIINSITFSRLLLLPVLLIPMDSILIILLISWIGISDYLDGLLARYWNLSSSFGVKLDQWADKIATIYLSFFFFSLEIIDLWFLILFILREIIMLIARYKKLCIDASNRTSKIKTFLIYLLFLLISIKIHYNFYLFEKFQSFVNALEISILHLGIMGLILAMKPKIKFFFIGLIGSGLYSSRIIKKAPGTITSVLFFVVCIYYAHFSQSLKFLFLALTAITHFIVYPLYASYINAEDPADYTLDEIVGVLFISYFLPNETYIWILAIVLFRFFDILKPFGIRKFETSRLFSSSMRVIGDDIIAAFYTLILIEAVLYGIK